MDDDNVIDDTPSGAVARAVYKPAHVISRFYTGNIKCQVCPDGFLASASIDRINFIDLAKGQAVKRIVLVETVVFFLFVCFVMCKKQAEEELVGCFAVRPVLSDGGMDVVVATKSLELKHYHFGNDKQEADLVRSWKSHTMPVSCMLFDPTGTVVACGSSDGRIFIYDLAQGEKRENSPFFSFS
jgi:WD40 repeat protein